ncbi:MAG: efflux RND transporter permease subunit [Gammaproteobacteria bacterium]|nr:efflux RND transporter permease subunit [Gammaproteobacteria bacterium]
MAGSGFAGRITQAFAHSTLTPLIIVVSLVLGAMALTSMPQEEDPQITVPFVDVFISTSGLKADDVVELVTKPFEDILKGIDNVEHTYSTTRDDGVVFTIRFDARFDDDIAVARVNDAIDANRYRMPPNIQEPLVIGRSIDDVAVIVLTLAPKPGNEGRWQWGALYDLAEELQHELVKGSNVGLTYIVGGKPQEVRIEPDPELLSVYGVTLNQLVAKIRSANQTFVAGSLSGENKLEPVIVGHSLQNNADIGLLVVTTQDGRPVYVRDVARVMIGEGIATQRAWSLTPSTGADGVRTFQSLPAVTLAIAKRKGSNGVQISEDVLKRLELVRGRLIPEGVDVLVSRDYGETARHKSHEMMLHLVLATVAIILIMVGFLGWREGVVVLIVIPSTILLTFFVCWLFGITLNRLTMYGIIFSVAILADDAIVITENISRHWRMLNGRTWTEAAVDAVAEVGNPTIIATLTVVMAMLPLLFVKGFVGPFLQPIPVAAIAAMLFSLLLAVTVAPWAMLRLTHRSDDSGLIGVGEAALSPVGPVHDEEASGGFFGRLFRRCAGGLLLTPRRARLTFFGVVLLTLLTFLMPYFKLVLFKIMPFDDKQDIQIQIDLPEGSTLEATERVLQQMAGLVSDIPEIQNMQIYAGGSGPFDFYGLVRQDYMRSLPEQGELRLRLLSTWNRDRESHDISLVIRERLKHLKLPENGVVKIVEAPPGPPAPYIVIAEIYGPDADTRRATARQIRKLIDQVPELAQSDDSFGNPTQRLRVSIDQESLEFHQIDEGAVYSTLKSLLNGEALGISQRDDGQNPLPIVLQEPRESLFLGERLLSTPISTMTGELRELGDVLHIEREPASYPVFRRDGRFADMVTAGIRGLPYDAPMYALHTVEQLIKKTQWPGGETLPVRYFGQPDDESKPSLLWMGEWDVTRETFAQLGAAFGYALLGIYILVVGQFRSFKTPLVVLLPVPLSFSGIIVGHWIMGSTYSMPSTIGLIALSGIVVRNSILLIEFIQVNVRNGVPMRRAALEAGAVRAKPIILTALAGISGGLFILPDAMLHGMGVALIFGLISSTVLTLIVIPAVYVWLRDDGIAIAAT